MRWYTKYLVLILWPAYRWSISINKYILDNFYQPTHRGNRDFWEEAWLVELNHSWLNLTVPLSSWLTLCNSLNHVVPQFPHLWNTENNRLQFMGTISRANLLLASKMPGHGGLPWSCRQNSKLTVRKPARALQSLFTYSKRKQRPCLFMVQGILNIGIYLDQF